MAIRVFLVEDTRHMQEVITDLLRSVGDFELAGSASTEAEAILWLQEHPADWDLAIIDLVLEQGTGMGVIAHCKPRAPNSRVVVFSDYVTPGIYKHCLGLGADAALAKGDLDSFIQFCSELLPTP